MDNDLILARMIENQVGIGRSHQASQTPLARRLASIGILQQEIDDGLNARLYVTCALRRTLCNKGQNLIEFGCAA
jgi:hypothetical protein